MKTIAALLVAIVSASIQAFAVEAPLRPGPPPAIGQTDGWWTGFDEPLLVPLQRLARARVHATGDGSRQGAVDAQVALTLIGMRTLQARIALVDDIAGVLRRQRELALADGPSLGAGRAVSELDARLAAAVRIRAAFAAQDEVLIGTMATLTGSSPDTARAFATSAGAGQDAARSAVAIPTYEPAAANVAVSLATDDPVVALSASADALVASLAGHRAEVAAIARRWNAGAASEREMLAAAERTLADEDSFAIVRAQLACAWIDAHARQTAGAFTSSRSFDPGTGQSVGSSR